MPAGTFTLLRGAVDRRHFEFAAERRRHHRDRHAAMQIGAVALEDRMRGQRQENIEVARGAAAHARLAFAGETDAGAVLHPLRNVDRQHALARDAARARAGRAGILDHLAAAVTGRAGALQREEALRVPHAAWPPQVPQAFGRVPALAPVPEQASQVTEVGMRISAVLP